MPRTNGRGASRAASRGGERWERRVEAVGADEERWRCGGSEAMDEDDGGREKDEVIYI